MRKIAVAMSLLICVLLSACSPSYKTIDSDTWYASRQESSINQLKSLYSDADAVIIGTPADESTLDNDTSVRVITVSSCIVGDKSEGDKLNCIDLSDRFYTGNTYLFFLQDSTDIIGGTEFIETYKAIEDTPFSVSGGSVFVNSIKLPLSDLINEMFQLDSVFSVPSELFYYNSFDDLIADCDEVFLGRITDISSSEMLSFEAKDGGITEQYYQNASLVKINALNVQKGTIDPGDFVTVVHSNAMASITFESDTLLNVPYTSENVPSLTKGDIYLFFLISAPDSWQSHYFFINPLQGFVPVKADTLSSPTCNYAMSGRTQLVQVLSRIRFIYENEITQTSTYKPFILD